MNFKKSLLVGCLTTLLGIGAAVGAAASAEKAPAREAKAAVTNGKYRFNVLTPTSCVWSTDNIWTAVQLHDNECAFLGADNELGTSVSNKSNWRQVSLNSTNYYLQTIELASDYSTTWWAPEFQRCNSSSGGGWWNKLTVASDSGYASKDINTVMIQGGWDNLSVSNYGLYYKVALHTGLSLENVSYSLSYAQNFMPGDPAAISGYTFDGWYTDSAKTSKYTQQTLSGDINLYAKYTLDEVTYKVNVGNKTATLTKEAGDANYKVQYHGTINVAATEAVSFTANDSPLAANPDSADNNNVLTNTKKILQTSNSAAVWLKQKRSDDSWEYWIGGRAGHYFLYSGTTATPLSENPSQEGQYMATSVSLTQGNTVELYVTALYNGTYDTYSTGTWSYTDGKITVGTTGTYNVYYTPSSTNVVYFGNPSQADQEATEFAEDFLDAMDAICLQQPGGTTDVTALGTAWGLQATAYAALGTEAKEILTKASKTGAAKVNEFASSYDFIYGKYGYDNSWSDFANRKPAHVDAVRPIIPGLLDSNGNNAWIWVVAITAAAAIGVGAFFFIKRRKEDR